MINDSSSVIFSLSLIPLALALHFLYRPLFPSMSLLVTTLGIIAMLAAAILQTLLVFGVLEFEQEIHPVLIANAVIGIWLITNGMMARVGSNLPQGLAWLSVVAGIGLILIIVGFWVGGQESLLTIVGGILSFIGILIWAIWLGKLFLAGNVVSSA